MNIPQIQIETTRGILGLQIQKPVQEIEQPNATISLEQPAAILEMSTTRPTLSLDTTEARADIDLKSIIRRNKENADYGKQQALAGIARRASEGQQLIAIEHGSNALVNIIKEQTTPAPAPLGLHFVRGMTKVQVAIQPGSLNIQVTPQQIKYDAQVNKPIHNYTPGKVTGSMEQWPSIHIDVKY